MLYPFQLEKHKSLYSQLSKSWRLVTHLGFLEYKKFIVNQLSPNEYVFRSCYACDYAKKHTEDDIDLCKHCPISLDNCNNSSSTFNRLMETVKIGDELAYIELCNKVINSEVRPGVITT